MIKVRKGQAPPPHSREEFGARFQAAQFDPAFRAEQVALDRLEAIAWSGYHEDRKAPVTRKAGPGFADPDYDASVEWLETRERLRAAASKQTDPATASRVLLICGAPRNDGSCPGEMSKTYRLTKVAGETLSKAGIETDLLDLSLITSEYRRHIHPCKACVSTAAVGESRAGRLSAPGAELAAPRPK